MSILDKNYLSIRFLHQRVDVLVKSAETLSFKSLEWSIAKGEPALPAGLKQWEGIHFEKVTISIDNGEFGLVPSAVFDAGSVEKYIEFSMAGNTTSYNYMYDLMPTADMVLVYAIDKLLYRMIVQMFPSAVFRHYASVCTPHFLKHAPRNSDSVYVHLCPDSFYMVLKSGGKLKICNRFVYRAPEDILYYILFGMEQTGSNPENALLVVGGEVHKNADAVILLKEFFAQVEPDETGLKNLDEMKYDGPFAQQYLCV